jgi:hypothetical protein
MIATATQQAMGRRLPRYGFGRASDTARRRNYSLVADSADNPQTSAAQPQAAICCSRANTCWNSLR